MDEEGVGEEPVSNDNDEQGMDVDEDEAANGKEDEDTEDVEDGKHDENDEREEGEQTQEDDHEQDWRTEHQTEVFLYRSMTISIGFYHGQFVRNFIRLIKKKLCLKENMFTSLETNLD